MAAENPVVLGRFHMIHEVLETAQRLAAEWGWWIAGASAIAFVATLVLVPVFVVRLPADYFVRRQSSDIWQQYHPVLRVVLLALKNAAGVVILLGGIIMLVAPGQGVLSIVIGLILIDFPGKRQLQRRIVGQRHILRALNALRLRWGRKPLKIEEEH